MLDLDDRAVDQIASSNSVSVPSIIAFICSSEMSSKSMTDVFLMSVKTDPFQFFLIGDPSS